MTGNSIRRKQLGEQQRREDFDREADMNEGITICDTERGYALRLTEYFYEYGDLPCEIRVCTDPLRLREMSPPGETALLIISQKAWEAADREGYERVLVLAEEAGPESPGEYSRIDKYQSSSAILASARQIYLESGPVLPGRARTAAPLRISGIYAPAGGCLRTAAALALGRILGEQKRTLYLSLEPCSGLGERLGIAFKGSLEDLVYFSECAAERFPAQLRLHVRKAGQLDLLPPARSFRELRSVTGEEWQRLLDIIAERTDYEELVLDLTEHAEGFSDLLRRCGRLWIPESRDRAAQAKLQYFRGILSSMGAEDIWGSAVRIPLPPRRGYGGNGEDRDYGASGFDLTEDSTAEQEEWLQSWIRGRLAEETQQKYS